MPVNVASVDLDLSGLDELSSMFRQRGVAKKAVKAAAKVVLPVAKSLAPRRTGALQQAQSVKAEAGNKGATGAYAVVGARMSVKKTVTVPGRRKPIEVVPGNYQYLVALGTRPHSLGKGSKLQRKVKPGNSVAVGQKLGKQHPGAKSNNFLKSAFEATKDAAGEAGAAAMAEETQKAIAKEAARLAAAGKT